MCHGQVRWLLVSSVPQSVFLTKPYLTKFVLEGHWKVLKFKFSSWLWWSTRFWGTSVLVLALYWSKPVHFPAGLGQGSVEQSLFMWPSFLQPQQRKCSSSSPVVGGLLRPRLWRLPSFNVFNSLFRLVISARHASMILTRSSVGATAQTLVVWGSFSAVVSTVRRLGVDHLMSCW